MKANELRIRNIVTIDNHFSWPEMKDVPVHIDAIILRPDLKTMGGYSVRVSAPNGDTYNQAISYIKPITLTPELLDKCGLIYDGEYITIKNSYFELKPTEDGKFQLTINSAEYETKLIVEYLHQLQNLYFALTGEELEIDLKTLQQ